MATFLTSDWHIGHENILIYEPTRPWGVDEMLWAAWEEQVRSEDQVWFLGDLCFGRKGFREAQIARFCALPGEKHWILGNHDRGFSVGYLQRNGIDAHKGFAAVEFDGVPVLLSHYPPFKARGRQRMEAAWQNKVVTEWETGKYRLCIHGHSHSKRPRMYGEHGEFVNVSPEVTGFRLVTATEIIGGVLTPINA